MSSAVPSNTMAFQMPRAMLRTDVALWEYWGAPWSTFPSCCNWRAEVLCQASWST